MADESDIAEIAGGFIHEIKNHLSTLNLNLQLLSDDVANPTTPKERKAKQRLDRIKTHTQKLLDLSNDFLRFTRAQELNKQPTDINEVLAEMVDFFTPTANAAKININLYADSHLPRVVVDKSLLKQALLNLMINAEQAMPDGGEIVLQTRRDVKSAFIDVIDTGLGMSAETQQKIFKPFQSTKPGGTGLGLPTTRKIILAHEGELLVQSEVGRGTKFTIELPIR